MIDFRNLFKLSPKIDQEEGLELLDYIDDNDKSIEQFIKNCPKSLWLWYYVVNEPSITLNQYHDLCDYILKGFNLTFFDKEQFVNELKTIKTKEDFIHHIRNEYFYNKKSFNFLASLHLHKGYKNKKQVQEQSLLLIKEWLNKNLLQVQHPH